MRTVEEKKIIAAEVLAYLAKVPDPRIERTRAHSLVNILVIALLAVLCGADSFTDMEDFGHSKRDFLSTFLDLESGIPSHDTFGRVLAMLDPGALQEAFRAWTASLMETTDGQIVAIDGKTLRRSFEDANNRAFVHMVSAWSAQNRLVVGQLRTEAKSNEITAIPKLIALLNLTGATVTIDAMGCQKSITDAIIVRGADYVIAVKDNQPTLFQSVKECFEFADDAPVQDNAPEPRDVVRFVETSERAHGRKEVRRCHTSSNLKRLISHADWASVGSVVRVELDRTVNGKTSTERRYFIASRPDLSAPDALAAVRTHWHIENRLHWVLDMAFREDECRVRAGNAAENFVVLRHFTMNLLKKTTAKVGIRGRRLKAGWDHRFLLQAIGGSPEMMMR